jgi:hypothetical protein
MNGDLDAWLNADVESDVAKAEGQASLVPSAATPLPVQNPQAKGLGKFGITRGGVIRNPNTKKVTMLNNPVANPHPQKPPAMTKAVKAPTPEEELKAQNPGLAIPTIMTGMDMDTQKRNGRAAGEPNPVPAAAPQAGQPMPVTYQSTLKDLLLLAVASGGTLHFGTGEFVLSIQIIKAPGSTVQG